MSQLELPAIHPLEAAARRWEELARKEIETGKWMLKMGHSTRGYSARVELYFKTAESLRLQLRTGRAHCACCLKPLGEGMRL